MEKGVRDEGKVCLRQTGTVNIIFDPHTNLEKGRSSPFYRPGTEGLECLSYRARTG